MMNSLNLLLFVVLSALAVVASLHAWRNQQVYGFFRFLAFETLALLIVWNISCWFRDPFSIQQIISWTILAISTVLAAHGFYLLKTVGKAQARIMENTRRLVEVGAYRYIRHPLYASLILFGWGVFFKGADLLSIALVSMATVLWFLSARYEERFNIDRFGEEYSQYMERTKMFIPFLL
ncbi:MAG TPA: isoprenylcysteine carboxylmethyltransferase family protein [Candidatus Marinimicrobia bacterium]|nr:isoprenylcysteine carboxylmethyltransferase family protein [Candidatus Neomarinimicrobiota bacterium]